MMNNVAVEMRQKERPVATTFLHKHSYACHCKNTSQSLYESRLASDTRTWANAVVLYVTIIGLLMLTILT